MELLVGVGVAGLGFPWTMRHSQYQFAQYFAERSLRTNPIEAGVEG